LRVVIIFRMTATMMTLDFLSAPARRLEKALNGCNLATSSAQPSRLGGQAMYNDLTRISLVIALTAGTIYHSAVLVALAAVLT
jgi:hypothetical protein